MIRTIFVSCAVVTAAIAMPPSVAIGHAREAKQAARAATPADVATFVGDWTLALQGPNGPGTFALTVKVENGKVLGEIGSDQLPKQPITDVSIDQGRLVLAYTFTWEGNPVDAVVSLAPQKDDKIDARIDFAGGAYVMTGPATKKETAK
jgi:hypothetical protein